MRNLEKTFYLFLAISYIIVFTLSLFLLNLFLRNYFPEFDKGVLYFIYVPSLLFSSYFCMFLLLKFIFKILW
jgi:hypothetical protein